MNDLIDIHRANIAKAGVALAEAISVATAIYTASIAASEAALELGIERRVKQFRGEGLPHVADGPSAQPPVEPQSHQTQDEAVRTEDRQ